MLSALLILVLSITIILFEAPSLLRKKQKKDLLVFVFLLLLGSGLNIAEVLNVVIPNPLELITTLYKPLSDSIFGLFEVKG